MYSKMFVLINVCVQWQNKEPINLKNSTHVIIFLPIPKKGNAKECSNYHTITLISHASRLILKILQARLQQYMNRETSVQAGFRKGRGTRDQVANVCQIIEKPTEFQKNIYICFIDYAKAFDCVAHNKLWKILQEMGIPDNLTCLLRNLYAQSEVSQKDKDQYSILTHIYGIQKDGNDNPICKTEKETQMYRTDFWTLWEKARVGCFERIASKHVYYLG